MKNKLKSSLKFVSLALILVLFVSIICMSGSATDNTVIRGDQSWNNLPSALPLGTVNYYKVRCRTSDSSTRDVYLKLEKNEDSSTNTSALNVYEAYYLDDLLSNPELSINFTAECYEGAEADSRPENWSISLKEENIGYEYSKILSVSPLCTTVISTQSWEGRDVGNFGNYIDVSLETTVKYALNDGTQDIQTFYVRKSLLGGGVRRLQISTDGMLWFDNSLVLNNGKTINALLLPSEADMRPERWIITVTGYDKFTENGKLIDYKIVKKDINSSQAWTGGETQLRHTFNGENNGPYWDNYYVYTLKLTDSSPESNETEILRIEKNMAGDEVDSIVIRGISESDYGDSAVYTTVVDAVETGNYRFQYADNQGNCIEFNNYSEIKIYDIINSENGVTVDFRIGQNNGNASVIIKLTESGKLSYDFYNLPADVFTPDISSGQDGTPIAVGSYRVDVTKG